MESHSPRTFCIIAKQKLLRSGIDVIRDKPMTSSLRTLSPWSTCSERPGWSSQ